MPAVNASGRVVLGQPSSLGTELSIDDTIDISDGSPARGVKLAYSAPAEEHLVVRTSDMATGLDPETRIVSLLDTRAQTLVRSAGFTLSDPHRRPDLCRVASVRAVAAKTLEHQLLVGPRTRTSLRDETSPEALAPLGRQGRRHLGP